MHLLHAGCPPLPRSRLAPADEHLAQIEFRPASESVFAGSLSEGWGFEIFDRLSALDPSLWSALAPSGWKDARYHRTLEETFAHEFSQFYLLLKDETGQPRALQPIFIAHQDITVSLPRSVRALLRPLRRLLRLRLLMVGCIVGEGRIGVPYPGEVPAVARRLDEALTRFAGRERAGLIVFKDFPSADRPGLATLVTHGRYTRLPNLPAVRLRLDFASFEEYMQQRLGKSTRKSLRRKFREVDNLEDPIRMEVKRSVTLAEAVALHALYEPVARRGKMQFEVFDAGYFYKLGERMPDQTRFFIWRQGGQVIAFCFCTVHGDTLYDNDLGMHDTFGRCFHLYHVTFRDVMRWALAQGLKHYQSSPFNYAPKRSLGLELVPQDIYVRHLSPMLNRLLRWFAPLAAPARQEPLLGQFPNAEALWCGETS